MILLLACAAIDDVVAEIDPDTRTLVHVSFTTPTAEPARVSYGEGLSTPWSEPSTEHTFTLLGLASGEAYEVVAETETVASAPTQVSTGVPPVNVPEFLPVVEGEGPGFVLTSVVGGDEGESSIVILDDAARITWYATPESGYTPSARFAEDGESLLYMVTSKDNVEAAVVRRQPLAGGDYTEYPAPYGHHDFIEVPGLEFAYIAAEGREVNGEDVVGDKIVERDLDGNEREVWNAFDWLEVEKNQGWNTNLYPFGADWTHANGLFYDEESDAYLISLYFHHTVVKVDRGTGDVGWFLGGEHSDFTLPLGHTFQHQHAPSVTPEGEVCVYDNAGGPDGSRGLCFRLEGDAATLAWSFDPADDRQSVLMGDVDRRADGGALVAFGEHGEIDLVSPDGALVWEVDSEDLGVVSKVEARASLYAD
ncbi:MAG: aryl-sulfate sulfotransferase [Deltaproteobacteria bacterium]|nr:aryl-sulfate sulfotransferase [Deltaproteobacteria bacterium]